MSRNYGGRCRLGFKFIKVESQEQGNTTGLLRNVTLSTLLVSTQGYQMTVIANSHWKGYSALDYGWSRLPVHLLIPDVV